MAQLIINMAAKSIPNGMIAPNAVAIALPPENPKKNGKMWPKQADPATHAR